MNENLALLPLELEDPVDLTRLARELLRRRCYALLTFAVSPADRARLAAFGLRVHDAASLSIDEALALPAPLIGLLGRADDPHRREVLAAAGDRGVMILSG